VRRYNGSETARQRDRRDRRDSETGETPGLGKAESLYINHTHSGVRNGRGYLMLSSLADTDIPLAHVSTIQLLQSLFQPILPIAPNLEHHSVPEVYHYTIGEAYLSKWSIRREIP
jgi:hypothetical protein